MLANASPEFNTPFDLKIERYFGTSVNVDLSNIDWVSIFRFLEGAEVFIETSTNTSASSKMSKQVKSVLKWAHKEISYSIQTKGL